MNTSEITNVAVEAGEFDQMAIEKTARKQPTSKSKREARMRYALLAVIVLSLGWMGFFVQNSINQINLEIQQIYSSIVTEGSLGPD